MAVDLVPISLALAFLAVLIITFVAVSTRSGRLPNGRIWLLACSVCGVIAAIYAARYHMTEIRYSAAAQRGDPEACFRLGTSYMYYGDGSPSRDRRPRRLADR